MLIKKLCPAVQKNTGTISEELLETDELEERSTIAVKASGIDKNGVFAARPIKRGEVVIKWCPKTLKDSEIAKVPASEKHYVCRSGKKHFLMQPPERFVNHSCEPNTRVENCCDVAIKDIAKGEEITSDYAGCGSENFKCNCGSKNCRGIVN
ncbi:MAG: SET domain-containing protein [Candidatus Riflebacteria bacterium]|nr:SET domain-containing protein [Candidatus Riflebacteria bacterium]